MSSARSGKNFRLPRPISHELYKKVLNISSPILSHILKTYTAPPNVARVMDHIQRQELFHRLVHVPSYKILGCMVHILSHELYKNGLDGGGFWMGAHF